MTITAAVVPDHMHPCRSNRLARGWEPRQLIGRLQILAAREDLALPKVYELIGYLFLWEQHREQIPEQYAVLIDRLFTHPNPFRLGPVQHLPMKTTRTRGR